MTLKGLKSNTAYTLSVIAVNSNSYQSHATTIPFFTQRLLEEPLPETNPLGLLSSDSSIHIPSLHPPISSRFRSKSLFSNTNCSSNTGVTIASNLKNRINRARNNSDLPPNVDNLSITTSFDIDDDSFSKQNKKLGKPIYTVESLENEVELIQAELQDVVTQKAKVELEHASVEQVAQAELEAAKAKRKADELSRAQLKSESKTLEETKHQLDTQRAKLDKANKILIADLNRKTAEKDKWLSDIESAKLKVSKHDNAISTITQSGQEHLNNARKELENLQNTTSGLDDEIKGLASSTKRTDSLKSASIQALTQAKGKTDKVTGIINDSFVSKILDSPDVHSKLKDALKSELSYEKQLEDEWKQTQKDLETRYLKVNVMYSEAKKAHDNALEMHNKGTQANDSNLVYEAVAAAASAAAGNANNVEYQGVPIQPTTSNLSTGKKRRGRSRRNTKSQASSNFIASPQQAYTTVNGTSNSPMYNTVSISPAPVQNRAVDQSPELPYTPLTTSTSALSVLNATTWDTQRPNHPTRTAEIQSPSALLPSYLLKDELTESLSSIVGENKALGAELDIKLLDSINISGRPSGGILGRALHKRDGSSDSLHSAMGSIGSGSLEVSSFRGELPFPNRQVSPQSSFSHLFQQSSAFNPTNIDSKSDNNSPFTSEDLSKQASSKGKFSSMFFFGKPRNQARSVSGGQPTTQDNSGGSSLFFKKNPHRMENQGDVLDSLVPPPSFSNSDEANLLGMRRRSGSLNSIGSLPVSLGESYSSNGMLNLWGDNGRSGNALEPSRSHISTTLSIDRNPNSSKVFAASLLGSNRSGFDSQSSGIGWSAFTNPNRNSAYKSAANSIKDEEHLEATWDHMPNNTITHTKADETALGPPLTVIGTSESVSPQPNKGRFSKGFASLFSSNVSTSSSNEQGRSTTSGPPRSVEDHHEQASFANSVSDGAQSVSTNNSKESLPIAPPKENILQKGIRTFSLPRKASSSGTSMKLATNGGSAHPMPKPSKFTMRRLSMFGKKESSKDVDEDLEVMKETDETKLLEEQELDVSKAKSQDESLDYQMFLSHAQMQELQQHQRNVI